MLILTERGAAADFLLLKYTPALLFGGWGWEEGGK